MTPAILASKRHRRYLERVWCRNPTALNRSRLTRQTHLCNRQMSKARSAHYSKIIAEHSGDYGSLWKAFNTILHCCPKMPLPDHSSEWHKIENDGDPWQPTCWLQMAHNDDDHSSIAALANTFSSFFFNKISVIRSFPCDSHSRVLNPPDTRKVLQNLSCVTADEVRHIVLRAPCKSSDLDPIPTCLVKGCIDILITSITSIINLSLTEGSFPSHFKSTHVSPFEKPSLNKDSMKNYRLVSNLSFLSKVLEKVVVDQLNSHINSSNTSNQYQSPCGSFTQPKPPY